MGKTMVWSNWPEAKEENKNTESEVMADKKTENRNIDTAKARGELEEDLLEYVYRKWRQGRQKYPGVKLRDIFMRRENIWRNG